jgi:hypothetical protein
MRGAVRCPFRPIVRRRLRTLRERMGLELVGGNATTNELASFIAMEKAA